MQTSTRWTKAWIAFLMAAMLSACGGGDDNSSFPAQTDRVIGDLVNEPNAPQQVGDTSADGLTWFNFRRQQAGLSQLARDSILDDAALGHSIYQRDNNEITHDQTPGAPSYTGATLGERLEAAGYEFQQSSYAYGEVISAATNPSGFVAADALITAIYHRFVILEPAFTHMGAGSSTATGSYTWFTANFAADGLNAGLGPGRFITWPAAAQTNVPTFFLTDSEIPDPLPEQNISGYPISIHADITSQITVQQFTLRQPGGDILPSRLLTASRDEHTPSSVAALIPLNALSPSTRYEARFIGWVDGVPVDQTWYFTTR